MTGLQDFRSKNPQYNDMSDVDLADALHSKYYSDIPKDKFYEQMGVSTPKPESASSIFGNLGTAFSQGLTLGTEDEMRAAATAATGGSYSDEMARLSKERTEFSNKHPWLSGGATTAGAVVPMLASLFVAPETGGASTFAAGARTAALLREIAAAKTAPEILAKGALAGAATGAASAEPGERETGAAWGAALGAGLPGALMGAGRAARSPFVQSLVQGGTELFQPERKAQRLMTEALGSDAGKVAEALRQYRAPQGLEQVPTTAAQASGNLDLGGLELASRTGAAPQWGQFEQARNRALYEALQQGTPKADFLEGLARARDLATQGTRTEALVAAQKAGGQAQNVRIISGPQGSQAVPSYAGTVLDTLGDIRNGESGKTPQVQTLISYVHNQLTDPNVPVTAEQLYGIRKFLDSKVRGRINPADDQISASAKAARLETLKVIGSIDDALDNVSNGKFSQYLRDYQAASKPVDSARAERNILESFDNSREIGGVPEVTAHKLNRAIENFGTDIYGPTLSPSTGQRLAEMLQFLRQGEDVIGSLKKGGTMGGGSQTGMSVAAAQKLGKGVLNTATGGFGDAIFKSIEAGQDSKLKDEMRRLLQDPNSAATAITDQLKRNARPTADQIGAIRTAYPRLSALFGMKTASSSAPSDNQ